MDNCTPAGMPAVARSARGERRAVRTHTAGGFARVAAIGLAALLATGCSAERAWREAAPALDEHDLARAAAEVDQAVMDAGLVWHDPRLGAYLDGVTAKLLAAFGEPAIPVRVRVLRDSRIGASALANGVIHIYSGMLAHLDNEAQLALLIGHELAHLVGRDALRELELRDAPRIAAGASSASTLASGSGFASTAGIESFERELERQADDRALRAILAAGYDASEAPGFFDMLLEDEIDAGVHESVDAGNHPSTSSRAVRCRGEVARLRALENSFGGFVGRESYESAIADVLLENARLDLDARRYDKARMAVDRHLAVRPQSAAGFMTRGQILASAGSGPGDAAAASAAFERAASLDPAIRRYGG